MGGFTYETRKKLTEQRILEAKAAGKDLTGMEKKLLPDPYYSVKTEPLQWMTSLLENGEAGTLSEIYKRELPGLVRVCCPGGPGRGVLLCPGPDEPVPDDGRMVQKESADKRIYSLCPAECESFMGVFPA